MRIIIIVITVCFFFFVNIFMPAQAAASDFTFHVPVALHNIPSQVSKWLVWIMLDDEYHNRVAEGQVNLNVTNGEYVGTVTVAFNARPGYQAATAKTYVIWLECSLTMGNNYDMPDKIMKTTGQYPYDPSKPYVKEIRGSMVTP
jgi:hypothetical protein